MRTALHPFKNESITVTQYIAEFGAKLDAYGNKNLRLFPRCPACGNNMYTKGETNPEVDGVFSHQPNCNGFCPLKESAGKCYEILLPIDEDPYKTKALRSSFFKHWKFHYNLMKSYLKVLDIFDFIKLIKYADKNKIWSYRHIEEKQIPYIFLVLKEYPPVGNKNKLIRKDWLRFWFDSRVRTLEDLWIHTNKDWILIKATYANPRNGKTPNYTQLKDTEIVTVNLDFLNKEEPILSSFVINQMHKEFNKELE
ncbi:hypothetical protein [Sulfurospirillum barnesii]|uniref:Uncharacterized protein n=1 Tax=Sulfurospirillum barnesii (strain ATCC 700032 / DSM 10660 / SES-3) TaxID=760154 RepID=I3XY29_SULBS|nr:hypothetical protein [Sulfurospirillum barnesii]AFL68853.1 hypothetical protein Sulba_1565 [Sulfurospirillum barnesii SES-3]